MLSNKHLTSSQQQRITELVRSGRFKQAADLAERAAGKHPRDPDIWYLVAGLRAESGHMDSVIECCQKVIHLNPQHAGALFNLATALGHTGRHKEATEHYQRCLELEPRNTSALTALGNAYRSLGEFESARTCYLAAQRLEPGNPEHPVHVGMTYHAEDKYPEAQACYREALKISPGSAEAWYCMGIAWQSAGSLENAYDAYRNALKILPEYLEAMNNLGHVLSEQGALGEAETVFRNMVRLHPGSVEAKTNLGVVFETMGKYEEAEQSYKEAIALNPSNSQTLCLMGSMLAEEGRTDEAISHFDRAHSAEPGLVAAIAGKAAALEKRGDIDKAVDAIEPVITAGTSDLYAILAYCKIGLRTGNLDTAIELASQFLAGEPPPSKGLSELNHVLGDLHEKQANYKSAFKYHSIANCISPCTYDHDRQVSFIDRVIENTSAETLARLPRARHDFMDIVFIVGMPRSGSSLVEQILSSHPDVFGAGELRFMGDITRNENLASGHKGAYPEAMAALQQEDVDSLAQKYIQPAEKLAPESRLITDKMPLNYLCLGLIALLFPNARVIHIRRAPLDNCLSLYFHHFNPMHSYSTDLDLLGKYYLEYERLMTHWKTCLDIPMLEIDYEEIVNTLEPSTRKLLEFCGLPWSENCLEFYNSRRFVKTPSYSQVSQPIYTSSIGRWCNYREHLGPLIESLGKGSIQ